MECRENEIIELRKISEVYYIEFRYYSGCIIVSEMEEKYVVVSEWNVKMEIFNVV